jgi:hypothetical protein
MTRFVGDSRYRPLVGKLENKGITNKWRRNKEEFG